MSELVSCLMVTKDREALARRAVECYARQTYLNRELVIVTDGTKDFCNALQSACVAVPGVRLVRVEEGLSLGELRNESQRHARGTVFAQWDDDDLYHPRRLALQMECMGTGSSCLLSTQLHWYSDTNELFMIRIPLGIWGTVLYRANKNLLYQDVWRGEDSLFRDALYEQGECHVLQGHGDKYIYCFHGRNTFEEWHHRIVSERHSISPDELELVAPALWRCWTDYPLDAPFLKLCGPQGYSQIILPR